MKQATQLALYGAIAMVIFQIIGLFSQYFGYFGESFYTVRQIFDLFGMATLVNFFYKLNQKQTHKINNENVNQFKE